MRRSSLVLSATLVACRAPTETPPAEPAAPMPPSALADPEAEPEPTPPAEPSTPKAMPTPTHVLSPQQPAPLDEGTTIEVEGVVIESIEASPEDPEAYPAGSGIDVTVVIRQGSYEQRAELGLLSAGYDSHPVAWLEDARVTLLDVADPHRAPRVSLLVERVSDQETGEPPERVRVTKDQEAQLADGTGLTLLGHGHKHTMEGQRSPLLIAVRWHEPGFPPDDQHTSVGPDEDEQRWPWRDRVIEVLDYRYDQWMELSITRRRLERVEAPSEASAQP